MFEYIRQRVRDAIMRGVNDAMAELQGPRETEDKAVTLQLEYKGESEPERPAGQKRGKS